MERPTDGRVFFHGDDVSHIQRSQIPYVRRQIGMIFQDHRLLMDRTVFDNVALPLVIDGYSHGDINKRVAAALDKVGLLGKERYQPRMLSGGEQQRVGIARAIVNKPPAAGGRADRQPGSPAFHGHHAPVRGVQPLRRLRADCHSRSGADRPDALPHPDPQGGSHVFVRGGSLMAIVRHKQPPLRRLMMYGWIMCVRPLPAWVSCGATRSPPPDDPGSAWRESGAAFLFPRIAEECRSGRGELADQLPDLLYLRKDLPEQSILDMKQRILLYPEVESVTYEP